MTTTDRAAFNCLALALLAGVVCCAGVACAVGILVIVQPFI
jgi:hypothetical protein